MILEKSKLKIKNKLTIAKIPNAMGEIISMAFVKDDCKNFVKINPNINKEVITPMAVITPNIIIAPFDSLPESWFDRYARNAGYRGMTQTAAIGANNPAKKEIHRLRITSSIATFYFTL